MSDLERYIVLTSLFNIALFYVLTITLFLIAHKTPLNRALGLQYTFWLALVLFWSIPNRVDWIPDASPHLSTVLWLGITLSTYWAVYALYRVNWPYGWRALLRQVWQLVRHR